jgi:transposase
VRLWDHTQAAFPAEARAAACYGPGVRALCCYLLAHQHLPVDRAAQLLGDVLGAPVSTGTLAAVLAEGAAGLEGFGQVVREQLAAAPVAHFDETGARVAGRLHWVHSASTPSLSLFTVHAKRGKVAMDGRCCIWMIRGRLKLGPLSLDQIAKARSSNATVSRWPAGTSTASS